MDYKLILIIIVVISTIFSIVFIRFLLHAIRRKFSKKNKAKKLESGPDYKILTKLDIAKQLPGDLTLLKAEGEYLSNAKISSTYFVHGTFVGNDPFNIVDSLQESFPKLSSSFLDKVRLGIRKSAQILARDVGNFTTTYEKVFKNITHEKIKTLEFNWSSANNHLARVRAAINLIENIYQNHPEPNTRILLIGHSHAGQIFSLLTKIINNNEFRINLCSVLKENNIPFSLNQVDIDHISQMNLDFVTLGTPVRYVWELSDNHRLLHFINHRGLTPESGKIKGLFNTRDGDYIQQWGAEGSDLGSFSKSMDAVNKQLDKLLGEGRNVKRLRENILKGNRLHNQGMHLLVDYGDNSFFPNFVKTAFGHGVYTQVKFLSFHLFMINKYLYFKN